MSRCRFFTDQFPAALYRLRWWWLACLAGNVIVIAVMMVWLASHPEVEQIRAAAGMILAAASGLASCFGSGAGRFGKLAEDEAIWRSASAGAQPDL